MVPIQAVKKRGFLRQLAEAAKRSVTPLREALIAAQGSIYSPNFQRGRLLISTSGSGQSGSFENWSLGKEFTQDNVFGLTEELIEICEFVIAQLSLSDSGSEADTDAIFAAMSQSDALTDIPQEGSDVTLIGWQNAYGGYGATI